MAGVVTTVVNGPMSFSRNKHRIEAINAKEYFQIETSSLHRPFVDGYSSPTVIIRNRPIDYFTVTCLVAWPLKESEAGGDPVLIETSLLFSC